MGVAIDFSAGFFGGVGRGLLGSLADLLAPSIRVTQIATNLGGHFAASFLEDRKTLACIDQNAIHRVLQQLDLRQRQIPWRTALFQRLQAGQSLFVMGLDRGQLVLGQLLDALIDRFVGRC